MAQKIKVFKLYSNCYQYVELDETFLTMQTRSSIRHRMKNISCFEVVDYKGKKSTHKRTRGIARCIKCHPMKWNP
jgi:hypothetical protein